MTQPSVPKSLGKYQIVRELGRGAMGVVYEGIDPIIGRRVAIKTARKDVIESTGRADEMMERFLREARAAGSLSHPNIITIYDASEQDGILYIAMEYVESGTLRDYLSDHRLSPEESVRVVASICNALAAAHDQGIVHRDIKPANIMMLPDGMVKVADFGIARVSDSNLTQEGAMIGTPHYMSPEQFMGQKVDPRSDLFSVGVILYEMLTGERPFTGEVMSTVMHQVLKVEPVQPKELNYAVNTTLSAVVMKSLSKSPTRRYQNGRAMAAALLESLKETPDPVVLDIKGAVDSDAGTMIIDIESPTVRTETAPGGKKAGRAGAADATVNLDSTKGAPEKTSVRLRHQLRNFAAVALVVLAGIGIVFGILLEREGEKEANPVETPAAEGNQASPPAVPVTGEDSGKPAATDDDKAGFTKVHLVIWFAPTREAYLNATNEAEPQFADCIEGRANVEIHDETDKLLGKGEVVGEKPFFEFDEPTTPTITITASSDGYQEREIKLKAIKPDTRLTKDIVLLKLGPEGSTK